MAHDRVENRLREIRTSRGMTQAELAEAVGVARVSIVAIETGRFLPTIETALLISSALKVPVEDIFWLKEDHR
ncbi:MAG TPA: helix-turn-helix transcriptional regulator [Anaerolineales bacterium]|nr:helix-turn-helix transcriptional regulator [Anaerolineales bacterium]